MNALGDPVCVYAYVDEQGVPRYEVVRYEPKTFRQRQIDERGNRTWSLNGARRIPYNLPALIEARDAGRAVIVTEGEKDADALRDLGFVATTNAGGAAWPWTPEFIEHFRGVKRVAIIADCDAPGRKAAQERAALLKRVVDDVRIVDIAPDRTDGYDVSDWIRDGKTADDLKNAVAAAPPFTPEPTVVERNTPIRDRTPKAVASELFLRGEDTVAHRVEGLLPDAGSMLLGAKKKVGKSVFLINLARQISRGNPFLGRRTKQGRVLYLSLDESAAITRERASFLGITGADDIVWVASRTIPMDWAAWLRQLVVEHKPNVIIADTMVKLASITDIQDYGQWNAAYRPLYALAEEFGCAFVVSAHNRKAGIANADAIAGSTAAPGGVDTIVILDRLPDGKRTIVTEQRQGEDMDQHVLLMNHDTLELSIGPEAWLQAQREVEQRVLDVLGDGELKRDEIIARAKRRTLTVKRALAALVDAGLVEHRGRGVRGDEMTYKARTDSGPRNGKNPDLTGRKLGPNNTLFIEDQPGPRNGKLGDIGDSWSETQDQARTTRDLAGPRNERVRANRQIVGGLGGLDRVDGGDSGAPVAEDELDLGDEVLA